MANLSTVPFELLDSIFEGAELDQGSLARLASGLGHSYIGSMYRLLYKEVTIDDENRDQILPTLLYSPRTGQFVRRLELSRVTSYHPLEELIQRTPYLQTLTISTYGELYDDFAEPLTKSILALPRLSSLVVPSALLRGVIMSWVAVIDTIKVDYGHLNCYFDMSEDHFGPSTIAAGKFLDEITEYMDRSKGKCRLRTLTLLLTWEDLAHPSFNHTPGPIDRWGQACAIKTFDENGFVVNFYTGRSDCVSRAYTVY